MSNPQILRFYESYGDTLAQSAGFGPDPTGVAVMVAIACLSVGQVCQLVAALSSLHLGAH